MANPRKFSEKIALHNQKQAEETAAFEQIMREVSDATSKPATIEETKPMSPREPHYRESRGRSVGVGPMRSSRPIEKARIDTSPYSSGAYLSPPPDTSWRRTNSDSALHQSAMGDSSHGHRPSSPGRRGEQHLSMEHSELSRKHLMVSPDGRPRSCCDVPRVPGINIFPSQQESGAVQIPIGNNTGSLPDLTNFHFPSPLPTPLDLEDQNSSPYSTSPQANSPSTLSPTSLPSRPLARFSFGSQGSGGSSHSPQAQSPGHSPGSRRRQHHQQQQQQQQLQGLVMGQQLPPSANHLFVPSPYSNSRYNHMCKGVALENSIMDGFSQSPQPQLSYQQQQQQQPARRSSPQPPQSPQQQQQQTPQCSPPLVTNAGSSHHMNSLTSYRNPPPLCRPSPQNSPGLLVQGSPSNYRSCSPADTASHSAPQSPVSQNLSPASSPGIGSGSSPFSDQNHLYLTQGLQQHFEQFSMLDNPGSGMNFIGSLNSNSVQYSQQVWEGEDAHYGVDEHRVFVQAVGQGSPEDGGSTGGGQELSTDPGYYSQSPSQLQYANSRGAPINPSGGSTQQTTPQTPNTPSSIPDIILTDVDEMSRHELVKDLGTAMAMSGSFDSDLFPSDETLREGLDPIDFDGLQMLTDPDMGVVTDPSSEDSFRLDRL